MREPPPRVSGNATEIVTQYLANINVENVRCMKVLGVTDKVIKSVVAVLPTLL